MAGDVRVCTRGVLQANDVMNDLDRQKLWNDCRLGLLLQGKVEMPGIIIDQSRFFFRLNQ